MGSTRVIASKDHVWRGKRRKAGDEFSVQDGELKLGKAIKVFSPAPLRTTAIQASPVQAVMKAPTKTLVARKTAASKLSYSTRAMKAAEPAEPGTLTAPTAEKPAE